MPVISKRTNGQLKSDWMKIKHAFSDTANDAKHQAKDMLQDSISGLKQKSTKAKVRVANYTAKRPLKALGIALLVGAAIGYLIKR